MEQASDVLPRCRAWLMAFGRRLMAPCPARPPVFGSLGVLLVFFISSLVGSWARPVTRQSAVARHGFDAPGRAAGSERPRLLPGPVSTPEGWRGRTRTSTVMLDDGARRSIDVSFGCGERVRHRSR
jgi:hypothetical protein